MTKNETLVRQAMTRPLEANVGPVDAALIRFAHKLTKTPAAMVESDLEPLRALQLDDRAIHDATQVVALFNYFNRMADGLGVVTADDDPPQ